MVYYTRVVCGIQGGRRWAWGCAEQPNTTLALMCTEVRLRILVKFLLFLFKSNSSVEKLSLKYHLGLKYLNVVPVYIYTVHVSERKIKTIPLLIEFVNVKWGHYLQEEGNLRAWPVFQWVNCQLSWAGKFSWAIFFFFLPSDLKHMGIDILHRQRSFISSSAPPKSFTVFIYLYQFKMKRQQFLCIGRSE